MGKKIGANYKKCPLCPFGTNNSHLFRRHKVRCLKIHKKAEALEPHPDKTMSLDTTADSEWESTDITSLNHDLDSTADAADLDNADEIDASASVDGDNESLAESIHSGSQDDAEFTSGTLPSPKVNRNYKCNDCGFTTLKPKIFLSHQIESHNADISIFPCSFCEYASKYKHKVQRHEQLAHTGQISKSLTLSTQPQVSTMERPVDKSASKTKLPAIPKLKVKLTNTGKGFSKVVSAKKSAVTTTKKTATLKKAADLVITLEPPEGINTHKCKLCVYKGKSRPRVLNHVISVHINAKMLKCKLCSYTTNRKIELYLHKNEHMSGKQIYTCSECSYTSYFKPNLDRHMENHGRDFAYKCDYCNFSTETSGALARHVSSQHSESNEQPAMEAEADDQPIMAEDGEEITDQSLEDGLYPCEDCGSAHKTAEDLEKHIFLKHPDKLPPEDDPPLPLDDLANYSDGGDMVMDDVDEDDEFEPTPPSMECKYCSYVAKWPSDYKRHMKVHSLERRFKCPICFKKYKYTGDLNVHIRRDHNQEPDTLDIQRVSIVPHRKTSPTVYRCPACPFKTSYKSEMERHSHIHGAEDKAYQCNYCTYQTYWRGDITRHLYRKHEEKIAQDDEILNHVIFRNDLVVPKGKARYGSPTESLSSPVDVKKEMFEPEFHNFYDPIPVEMDKEQDWDTYSTGTASTGSKDVTTTLTGATNNNGIYHCDHCEFTANAPSKMKAHVATHLNFKQFMCPVCGKRANWKWDIQKHMKRDHPETNLMVVKLSEQEAKDTIGDYLATMPAVRRSHHLPSPTKTKPITPKVTLNIPVIRRPSSQEPVSQQPSALKSSLGVPVQKSNPVPILPRPSPNAASMRSPIAAGRKPYQCSICGLRSNFRWSISKHLKTIHEGIPGGRVIVYKMNEMLEDNTLGLRFPSPHKTVSDESRKLYMCVVCGKKCILKGDIKKHYKYRHPGHEVKIKYLVTGQEFLYDGSMPEQGQHANNNSNMDISLNSTSETLNSSMESNMDDASLISDIKKSPDGIDSSLDSRSRLLFDSIATSYAPIVGHQTSIHNNPKKHGYVKPFKCSLCGHRSNWKWDTKRHLKDKHRGETGGHIIVMSIEDATSTYAEECLVPASPEKKPASLPPPSQGPPILADDTERLKRLKCGHCEYRSNWRTDIVRHSKKRHPETKTSITILDMDIAKETLDEYNNTHNRSHSHPHTHQTSDVNANQTIEDVKKSPKSLHSKAKVGQRIWKCPKCAFCGVGTSEILKHMQKHNMKPFKCLVCEFTTNFRGALYRHVRNLHSGHDYATCTKVLIKYSSNDEPENSQNSAAESFREAYVDVYLCKICNFQTSFKHLCCKHLRDTHENTDYTNVLKIRKRQKVKVKSVPKGEGDSKDKGKKYMCSICPYKAFKHGLLNFHMTYHEPQSGNKYKCKFCPYFVCTPRLLQQHMKLHTQEQGWYKIQNNPNSSPMKKDIPSGDDSLPRKHTCEKCPYTTNSKNDFIYHKQFHRPKPSAEFKCEFCDYWVTHKRLLKQHMKLHTDAMNLNMNDSIHCSPSKTEESSIIFDTVEIAAIKQKIISSKITASLSSSPAVSPMKIASKCGVGSRPGYVLKSGVYRKLHRCKKCPYFNVRTRNLQLHEMMHGYRPSANPLLKCPHCDYYVGARGLLSHHLKVHQPNYSPESRDRALPSNGDDGMDDDEFDDKSSDTADIHNDHKVDTLLEIARFKKFCCEKCPYATAKRFQFQRHCELHGSKQRHTCDFCDYSVPSNNLLLQHRKIHMMPNQNLLAAQSLTNLQHLTEVPADVALASALPPVDMREPVTISVIHDHLDLYENMEPSEPKKLYRCDRCPYANVRRDHLLTHLKFHVMKSELCCPYCDYSVPKQHFLTQHIKVHFCPLPELSDWLVQNGQGKRAKEIKDQDISEALELAQKCQEGLKEAANSIKPTVSSKLDAQDKNENGENTSQEEIEEDKTGVSGEGKEIMGPPPPPKPKASIATTNGARANGTNYICQYCDREFAASENLLRHEMQHLIGNHFENDGKNQKHAMFNEKLDSQHCGITKAEEDFLEESMEDDDI